MQIYFGVGLLRGGGDPLFERNNSALHNILQSPGVDRHSYCRSRFPSCVSRAFVDKLPDEPDGDVLREGGSHAPRGVDGSESVNALVAPTDAKVSTIPSSNRFAFTLVTSVYRSRLNRKCATGQFFEQRAH